jgi:hypothetical protein
MPNRLERFLDNYGGLAEIILSLAFFLTGIIGITIYVYGSSMNVPHSLAFLAIMIAFIFIGFALAIDFLMKAF